MTTREVAEGRQAQGVDEQITYTLTTTNWAASPTDVSVVAKDLTNASADVSSTVLSGSASVSGNVITLPVLKSLTVEHLYRIEVKFTVTPNVYEAFVMVQAET